MAVAQTTLAIRTHGKGLHEITDSVAHELARSGLKCGTVTIFCQHTSCSLMIFDYTNWASAEYM